MQALEHDFRITTYPCRVYSGKHALGNLPAELKRQRAKRAFIICGRSVSRKTDLITNMRALLGDTCAGVYDEMGKDTPIADVLAARDQARAANADLLIAVGAGSVMQGVRIVAILLAEEGAPEELMTQYPEDGRAAISPKLMATKLPIINVVTAATGAANRAGSPAKSPGLDHRMEYFDPKTRPVAMFWDSDALMTAPLSMMVGTAAYVFWRAAMNMGQVRANPLVYYSRLQCFELVRNSFARLETPEARIDLCIASFLSNRQTDDGGARVNHWVTRVVYAFSAAIFNLHEHVGQGQVGAALTPTVMRHLGHRDPEAMCNIGRALGVWNEGDAVADAPARAADALQKIWTGLGMPANLTECEVPRDTAEQILQNCLKTFNVDPKQEFKREVPMLRELLQACWG
jgi:alcohol dehydrogenase class IV